MNDPLLIGITGGIGVGKSIVSSIFKLLGVPVYDADSMAKKLMKEDEKLVLAIKDEFGTESYVEGKLNRQFLAEKVFKDELQIKKLNVLVHPRVAENFANWIMQFDSGYIIKEAALLFETGSYRDLDSVILVLSPLDIRIKRIKNRDPQRSSEQIKNIIDRQLSVEKAKVMADFVIYNDESQMLISQVLELHNQLIKKADPDLS